MVKETFIGTRRYVQAATKVVLSNIVSYMNSEVIPQPLEPDGKFVSPNLIWTQYPQLLYIHSFRHLVHKLFFKTRLSSH